MNISLSDFRNVLGVKNDGNVVFTQNGKGIEKADYGNAISNMFRNVRTTPNDPEQNKEIRTALARAIQNSAEGKVISAADMGRIKGALGLGATSRRFCARRTRSTALGAIRASQELLDKVSQE